ncbi:MAG: pyrroline-5-carboxylate reductase [Anaerolineae bacterium]|nr:MAG: pyrroline-5-carboxylate reductase [Anaerolineae bacterium]
MLNKKIAFIGSGAMGEAMIAGLLRQGLAQPEHLLTADVHAARVSDLQHRYGTHPFTDNREAASQADLVVLSVKPQRLTEVLKGLRGAIPTHALVLSIVAGAKMSKISHGLSHEAVVRSMPNTPAQIGQGITVWIPSPAVTEPQKTLARQLLSALGKEIEVDDENYLDMATALSGTGPAYIFLFMEAMIDAGVHMGFSRQVAEQLVVETIKGSVAYFEARNHKDQVHVAALRNQVTSPGGTTAQALYYLEKAGFRTAVSRAIWAAYERSIELGKEKTVHIPETNSGTGGE